MTLNRFQTGWLVWRHQLGWGQLAPYCWRMAQALLIFGLAGTFFDTLLISGIGAALQTHDGMRMGSTLLIFGLLLVGEVLLLAGGIVRLRQAAQAERGQVKHIHGTCFAVLHPPPRSHPRRPERPLEPATPFPAESEMLFARIGSSAQDARWYALPASWHEVLEDPQAALEVVVLQGTEWVVQLNHRSRLDELRWATTHFPGQWYQASPEEVRALRHALRRVTRGWGLPPRRALRASFELIGIGVPMGLVLVSGAIAVWAVPGLRPRVLPTLFLVYGDGWMLLVGFGILLTCIWQGGQMLLAWRRGQQEQETVTLEGCVVGIWSVSGLAFKEGEVHLLQVERADGTKAAVALGAAFRALLPEPGAEVRITALAKAEIVTNLQIISSP